MAGKALILDHSEYDVHRVIADLEEIRRYNMQRHEMEQLTAVVHDDPTRHVCVGYKDVGADEFWARGHMPGAPLMPGVIMCEAAAQLCSYYVQRHKLLGARAVGFGALDGVRFRDIVRPGSRLVIVAQMIKVRPNTMISSRFQGFVERHMVVEGLIKGVPLPDDLFARRG